MNNQKYQAWRRAMQAPEAKFLGRMLVLMFVIIVVILLWTTFLQP